MKKALRKQILEKRNTLSPSQIQDYSDKILKKLQNLNVYDDSKNIMIYMDYKNEVATKNIIADLWKSNKMVIIPRVNTTTNFLDLYKITSFDHLIKSKYGILEPDPTKNEKVSAIDVDLILSPGVCFDKNCNRMGYGGGFYDKLLETTKPSVITIGLAFQIQIVESVPTEVHDKKLNYILTEEHLYTRST
jgi:5-formyltetrahydrofolate cyclo-ligase